MYQKRFPDTTLDDKSLEQVRGMEGMRVRAAYAKLAKEHGVEWTGRSYDQDDWYNATPANRALSSANACLYGICHAAIVSAGYSAAFGFIHAGRMLSFVYDVADFYKVEVTVPLAFQQAAAGTDDLERRVRLNCRSAFHEARLMERIIPDIAEVFDVDNDPGESPEELEGRAVSLADRAGDGHLPGQSESASPRGVVEDGDQESG
jgi:CRISPR-associated protein Cas1